VAKSQIAFWYSLVLQVRDALEARRVASWWMQRLPGNSGPCHLNVQADLWPKGMTDSMKERAKAALAGRTGEKDDEDD
jgi:hypothetical protein